MTYYNVTNYATIINPASMTMTSLNRYYYRYYDVTKPATMTMTSLSPLL